VGSKRTYPPARQEVRTHMPLVVRASMVLPHPRGHHRDPSLPARTAELAGKAAEWIKEEYGCGVGFPVRKPNTRVVHESDLSAPQPGRHPEVWR
jgi:hypothetical protein